MPDWKTVLLKYTDNIEIVLPDVGVQGEPFWALMEIKSGENTGNYHSIGKRNGKTMIMLFPQRQMAEWAAGQLRQYTGDFEVRGISAAHLEVLLKLYDDGYPLEFIVSASALDSDGKLSGASLTSYHIREALGSGQ